MNLVKNGGLYIGKEGRLRFGHMGGFGWEIGFEFLKVGGVYEVGLWGRVDGCEW